MQSTATHVFSSSALTLCFGLSGKDHTFDGRVFLCTLLGKDSGLRLGFSFRVLFSFWV